MAMGHGFFKWVQRVQKVQRVVVAASPQVMAACGGGLCRKVVFASLKEKERI